MLKKDFLLEIGTEELPPQHLPMLVDALLQGIEHGLSAQNLRYGNSKTFATPRRLAVFVKDVDAQRAAKPIQRYGPTLTLAYDSNGKPTRAALGFAAACGVAVDALQTEKTTQGERLMYRTVQAGTPTIALLAEMVKTAIQRLPIAKSMRWGAHEFSFIRPVRWLLLLLDNEVVPAVLLGKQADRFTYGHRFHFPQAINIKCAQDYVTVLPSKGYVIADFVNRKKLIATAVQRLAAQHDGTALYKDELLDEITAMVEYPIVLRAKFDAEFLKLPQEVLIAVVQQQQKSFPLVDSDGNLLPHFLFVANIKSQQAQRVITGNEKVMQARLADAEFFYNIDLKTPLIQRLPKLKDVIFEKKLGNLYARSERLSTLSGIIAARLNVNVQQAKRAGLLAKCDLASNMVGEFPELQGIIGSYYAVHGGEASSVVKAISQQYQPEFSGDALPDDPVAQCVALADKLDLLIGIFAIGERPTGDKDPFGLRRAAIGVLRILIERQLDLDLMDLIAAASKQYKALLNEKVCKDVQVYIVERLKYWYVEQRLPVGVFHAVEAKAITNFYDFAQRVVALQQFADLPQANNLSRVTKRVHNILRNVNVSGLLKKELLQETAEKDLYIAISSTHAAITPLLAKKDYTAVLAALAVLQQPVATFFAEVMVMTDDNTLKANRLCLLKQLATLLGSVADMTQLA